MDARQDRFGQVLHLVQPATNHQFSSVYEPGTLVTFTNRSPGQDVAAAVVDPVLVQIPWTVWTDLGRPDQITIGLRPGVVSLVDVGDIASSH